MADTCSAQPDLEALLIQSVVGLVGEADKFRFGVAVSGGPDSMALLNLAARCFAGRVEAATVDHGLRPESAEEAAMVAQWCSGRGLPQAVLRPPQPLTGNVQQWARTQRYAALEGWRAERSIDWLFTAHHADDQLETILMRLNRGAGVNGLSGIRARQGHVLRPLLGVRRADLLEHVRAEGLPFVNDPSNVNPRFDRVAIRQHLEHVSWLDPLAAVRSAAALAECGDALDWMVKDLATAYVRQEGDAWLLTRTDFPRELLRRLLLHIVAKAQPGASPRGDTIDRAVAAAAKGGQASLGALLVKGGMVWKISVAPPRH
ncbi:MAG TPA: tRNA lysidine(34) synthetase TilS [Sphingobium sp.]|nr:tRNA lysidine(34) synthetase TilS [Sphingobium sp.]